MSSIHPFSQAGFWDFVARLNDRSKAQGQAVLPGNERAMGRPNRGRKGLGRRGRNAVAANEAPTAPLTQIDPIPYDSTSDEFNEKGLPPQYPSLPYSAEPAFPLDEKMATDAMPPTGGENRGVGPRGRGRGHGPRGNGAGGRRMRNVLFENEDALSEEEKAARAERRRLRREANGNGNGNGLSEEQKAARAERRRLRREANGNRNGNGNGLSEEEKVARAERRRLRREANGRADGPGPNGRRMRRAFVQGQDVTMENSEFTQGENTQQFQQRRGGPNGPRRGRIAEAPGPRSMQPGSENLVDAQVSDEQNIGPRGQRGGLRGRGAARGGRGMNEARRARLEGIRGGPRKIAALVEQGAIPSNGRNANSGRGQGLGPRARQMAFRERAQAPGTERTQCGRGDGVLANPRQAKRQQMRWQMVNQPGAAPISSDDEPTSAATPRDVAGNNMQGTQQVDGKPKRAGGKRNKKFKPQADVYETEGAYIVHLPVPGASEKDIGVMWDTEKNVLRIAGIVQRPDIQQVGPEASMLRRQRPVGPFKRVVKFGGKKNDKVKVYENGISATLEDGILKVEVPKYDGDQTASDNEYVEVTPAY